MQPQTFQSTDCTSRGQCPERLLLDTLTGLIAKIQLQTSTVNSGQHFFPGFLLLFIPLFVLTFTVVIYEKLFLVFLNLFKKRYTSCQTFPPMRAKETKPVNR